MSTALVVCPWCGKTITEYDFNLHKCGSSSRVVDATRLQRKARIAALREVRAMVLRRSKVCLQESGNFEIDEIRKRIDALIAKEER